MESKRLELKVGLFVFIGLILLAALLIAFSKGTSSLRGTYTIYLTSPNAGGLKQRASVLLAGVQVGGVSDIKLAPDGRSVTITLRIYNGTTIYRDADFVIEQAGFLGDQFIAINPTLNEAPVITNNEVVPCEAPFDMQAAARSATGFIERVNDTVSNIETSVQLLQQTFLNQETMTNLSATVVNLRAVSDHANGVVGGLDSLMATNSGQINSAVSNVVLFSQKLTQLASNADAMIATNGTTISGAMTNLEMTTATLRQIADGLQQGKGLAGTVLENEQLAANIRETANNLAITTSNLNQFGLWHVLWHHEPKSQTTGPPK